MSDDKETYIPDENEQLPDGIELDVVDTDVAEGDDASVDVMALAQEDMASAESHEDEPQPSLERDLSDLLNRYSAESVSGTPDFIIAKFLLNTLKEFNEAVSHRAWWRGEFVDFNPSRDVNYTDHFSGDPIENPNDVKTQYYSANGKWQTYEEWKASQASQE